MAVSISLREAVAEVHNILTGLDLSYDDRYDIFHACVRQLNRSLRTVALEEDWGWYADDLLLGVVSEGDQTFSVPPNVRLRVRQDDAIRLVDPATKKTVRWAYFLPRDSLSKYWAAPELRAAFVRNNVVLSRPLLAREEGLEVWATVMREPRQTTIPDSGTKIPDADLSRPLDFENPDMVIAHAAWQMSLSNPLYQPRAQTLEDVYNNFKYALTERDSDHSDSPMQNSFTPSYGDPFIAMHHPHPHSDRR